MYLKKSLILLSLILLLSGIVKSQAQQTGSFSGFVYDAANGEVLIGVNVYLVDINSPQSEEGSFGESMLGSSTNTSGYYIIPQIPFGKYKVVCDYIGYQIITKDITFAKNEKMDFKLSAQAIQGAAVEVFADSIRISQKLYEKPISDVQLSARQINTIPQVAEADLLRALQTLPGILPVSDFSTALYVRGGTPDQNLYLLDGTDVYNPEHAFGIFSTFNTDAIKHVELSKGGFGATYGGRLSSILDVTNLDGNREEFEGSASISLLSAKTTLQMPIGNIGAISGSIRRTYFDKTLGPSIEEIPDYYFYDGNIKAFFELDPKNKITISLYGGRDVLNFVFNTKSTEETGFEMDWGNRTGSLRWTRVFNPKLFANFWITSSRFSSDLDLGETVPVVERNVVTDLTFKGNLEFHYSRHFHSKFGFEQKNLDVLYKQTFPGGLVNVNQRPKHYVLYLQSNWLPSARWDFQLGLRYNYFNSQRNFQDFEPRFSAKYRLTSTINLRAAAGMYNQYLHRIPRSFVTDIWSTANEFQDQSGAFHLIFGFQQEIAENYQLEIEAYYKGYDNIYAFNQTFITELQADEFTESGGPVYTQTRGLFNNGDGNSTGFEIQLRKDIGIVTGWLGYSFVRTEFNFPAVNDGKIFMPRHDRRSTVNFVGNVDLSNAIRAIKRKPVQRRRGNWTFGFNFVYSSGQPLTAPGSAYIVGPSPNWPKNSVEYYPAVINNFRLPHYARLDINFIYTKRFKSWTLEPFLQIYNFGNRKNVWFIEYDYNNGIADIETINMFPLLPTLGVNIRF